LARVLSSARALDSAIQWDALRPALAFILLITLMVVAVLVSRYSLTPAN
jgi:hypothetical protein